MATKKKNPCPGKKKPGKKNPKKPPKGKRMMA